MGVGIIYAKSENGVIGINNQLPWHIPEDLHRFKTITTDGIVVMGRKTWDSIPEKYRPLHNRINVVLSKVKKDYPEGVLCLSDVDEVLNLSNTSGRRVWIIGGLSLYNQFIQYADYIHETLIHMTYDGDTFIEPLGDGWVGTVIKDGVSSVNTVRYSFIEYHRR